jgi:hypothetical protein
MGSSMAETIACLELKLQVFHNMDFKEASSVEYLKNKEALVIYIAIASAALPFAIVNKDYSAAFAYFQSYKNYIIKLYFSFSSLSLTPSWLNILFIDSPSLSIYYIFAII